MCSESTLCLIFLFFFSSRRRHTRLQGDWSSDVCSSDLGLDPPAHLEPVETGHPDVEDEDVRAERPDLDEPLVAVGRHLDLVPPAPAERLSQAVEEARLIVDDEYPERSLGGRRHLVDLLEPLELLLGHAIVAAGRLEGGEKALPDPALDGRNCYLTARGELPGSQKAHRHGPHF